MLKQGLSRLDELEGTSRDHYERLPIRVEPINGGDAVFWGGDVLRAQELWIEIAFL